MNTVVIRYWVRNQEGQRWGPLQGSTLELMIPEGMFKGKLQASVDGEHYAEIGRFPELREHLDERYWGLSAEQAAAMPPPPGLAELSAPEPPVAVDSSGPAPDAAIDPNTPAPDAAIDPSTPAPDAAIDPSTPAPQAPASVSKNDAPAPVQASPEADFPDEGQLGERSPFALAFALGAQKLSGRLELRGPQVFTIYYKKGKPEHVACEGEELGAWLVAHGKLDAAKCDQAAASAPQFGGSFTGALFALGLMDPGTGFQLLASWASEIYQRALLVEDGDYCLTREEPSPADAFPLGASPYEHLVKAARSLSPEDVRRRLGPRLKATAMKTNAAGLAVEDLKLGPQETRLHPLFDGVHSIETLAEAQGDQAPTLLRLSYLLAECGFLSFVDLPEAKDNPQADPVPTPSADAATAPTAPASPAPAPAPASPVAAAAPEETFETTLKTAKAYLARIAKGDHFTALGLPRNCGSDEVKTAFNKVIRRYHPDRASVAPEALRAEAQQVYRDIFDAANLAQEAIGTDSKRRAYLNALAEAELEGRLGKVDSAAAAKVAALNKAIEAALDRKDYADAEKILRARIEHDDKDAAALSWLAWVLVLGAKNRAAVKAKALELVTRGLKMNPRCADCYLNAARIAKAYGDAEHAKLYLAKAKALGAKLNKRKSRS